MLSVTNSGLTGAKCLLIQSSLISLLFRPKWHKWHEISRSYRHTKCLVRRSIATRCRQVYLGIILVVQGCCNAEQGWPMLRHHLDML